jgi:mono/diheme cytochrome c family protein
MTGEGPVKPTIPAVGILAALLLAAVPAAAEERHLMAPRVPAHRLAEARALANPLPDSAETIERGKGLYHGKGACVTCHGVTGEGDGQFAMGLDPSPRNFHHHGFWRHRTDGEIFWVVKHGSPGTAMIGFGDLLTDEEVWALVQYLHGFAGEMGHHGGKGPGPGMGGRHGRGGCCDKPDASP